MTFTAWNFANKASRDAYHAETKCITCGGFRTVYAKTNGAPHPCDNCAPTAKHEHERDQP